MKMSKLTKYYDIPELTTDQADYIRSQQEKALNMVSDPEELNRDDITVAESRAQFFISNVYGRGLRLDILAKDQCELPA